MGLIIGAVVALGTLIWAIARILEGMNDAKYAARRFSWTRKAKRATPETLHDPREAAAVLLTQMAAYETGLVEEGDACVRAALLEEIARDEGDAADLMAFANALLKDVGDAGNTLRKFVNPINDACSVAEKEAFVAALEKVARMNGGPSDVQTQFLQSTRRLLLST